MIRVISKALLLLPLSLGLLAVSAYAFLLSTSHSGEALSNDPRLMHPARQAAIQMAMPRESFSDDVVQQAALVNLASSPLEHLPYALIASSHYDADEFERARRLLAVARTRGPRSVLSLIQSVDVHLAVGDIAGAVTSLEILQRLEPVQRERWQATIDVLTSHPETGQAAIQALRSDATKLRVFRNLAKSGMDSSTLLRTIKESNARATYANEPSLIAELTRPFIESRDYQSAFEIWAALTDQEPEKIAEVGFASSLPPPFGWELTSGPQGYAVVDAQQLVGQIYGRKKTQLARRLVLLQPGSAQLSVTVAKANRSIDIQVRCAEGKEIRTMTADKRGILNLELVVPEDCKAQWLLIEGRASDPPKTSDFSIEEVNLLASNS